MNKKNILPISIVLGCVILGISSYAVQIGRQRLYNDRQDAIKKDMTGQVPAVADDLTNYIDFMPKFSEYGIGLGDDLPVVEKVNLESHPRAKEYKTILQDARGKKANFAYSYYVVEFGCGSDCQNYFIIDTKTGNVYFPGVGSIAGVEFYPTSKMFVVNPPTNLYDLYGNNREGSQIGDQFSEFYVWENNEMKFIKKDKINYCLAEDVSKVEDNLTEQSAMSLISDKCNYDESNVGMTECIIELLDRTAAEREWKQRKIEMAKHPQINKYDLIQDLGGEQSKIKVWREGFEKYRDSWCDAEKSFYPGMSGFPGDLAHCQLEFEVSAINILNNLYYETIMKNIYDSQGVKDFEPTKLDIDKLMKTNKTKRGCVWAGENENCDE